MPPSNTYLNTISFYGIVFHRMRPPVTQETLEKMREMILQYASYSEIMRALDVSYFQVLKMRKEMGLVVSIQRSVGSSATGC